MTSQSSNGGGKECTLTETNTIHRNYCKNVSACSNRREVLLLALDHSFPGTAIRWDSLLWQADTNSLDNRIERNKIDLPVTMVVHSYSSINITCTMYVLTSHGTSNAWWWQTRHTTNKLAKTIEGITIYTDTTQCKLLKISFWNIQVSSWDGSVMKALTTSTSVWALQRVCQY